MTRTRIHHVETGFTRASADMSPSRRAGSSWTSKVSGPLGTAGLGGYLEMGSHRDGPLRSSGSEVCAPLSTLPHTSLPGWTSCLPSLECCRRHKGHVLWF